MEPKFCPFTKESCLEDCALHVNTGCAFSVIAGNVAGVEDQLGVIDSNIENGLQEVASALRNIG